MRAFEAIHMEKYEADDLVDQLNFLERPSSRYNIAYALETQDAELLRSVLFRGQASHSMR